MFDPDSRLDQGMTVFCLHFLGGSGRGWRWVAERLPPTMHCTTIDVPGFGSAAAMSGYTVEEMARFVMQAIRQARPRRWMLVGHSMGAKLAAIVARHAEDGEPELAGLEQLILLAGSPPGPEPMQESQRRTMSGWFAGDDALRRSEADGFVTQNIGSALHPERHALAVDDVLRSARSAWLAWLGGGSQEDWADRVGVLRTPALIVAGAEDGELGPDAQARLMAPHFARHQMVTLEGAGHLLPLERAEEVARLIVRQAGPVALAASAATAIGEPYWALLHSDRVSSRTRAVLLARLTPDQPAAGPAALTAAQLATLRALMMRVLPQAVGREIDLALQIDAALATGSGDGWRFADLPSDPDAYRAGLQSLDVAAGASGYAALDAASQDALLEQAAAGTFPVAAAAGLLNPAQMRLWFEDVRSDTVRLYVAHPATLARIGYSGIAYGGDGPRKSGFVDFGIGRREPWEPLPRVSEPAS